MTLHDDVLGVVRSFVGDESYISMATVCSYWNKSWNLSTISRHTRAITSATTPDMLTYAFRYGLKPTEDVMSKSASLGRLDLVKICAEFKCPFGINVSNSSSEHSQVVEWLVENDCPMDYTICIAAAGQGEISILKWAMSMGFKSDSYTFSAAARNGHIQAMEYLLSVKCPWISYTCKCAARNGQTDAFKWLVENGCPQ